MKQLNIWAKNIIIIVGVAVLYTITAQLSDDLAISGAVVSPVWPPAGIALAAILIFGNVATIGLFIGAFFGNFHTSTGGGVLIYAILNAIVPSFGAPLQAYAGALALKVFAKTYDLFENTKSVMVFILVSAFAACLINSTLGISVLVWTGHLPAPAAPYAWFTWWIGDAVGVITVTSTIMAWYGNWGEPITLQQLSKIVIIWVLIILLGYITFLRQEPLAYLLIPFALLATFQFDKRFATLTGIIISAIAIYGAVKGYGEFLRTTSINDSILLLQTYISVIFLTILLTYSILSDRQRAYYDLKLLNAQLERRVEERTEDLSRINRQLEIQKSRAIEALDALKHSQAQLVQAEKMASLGVLTAGVAHEINNPLNYMSSNIESIKMNVDDLLKLVRYVDQIKPDGNVQDKFNKFEALKKEINLDLLVKEFGSLIAGIKDGIKRTSGIVSDLRTFARLDEAVMKTTDLHQNIDSTLNLLSSEIKDNISVIKEYGDIPPILCHPGKLNQVIMNILINAIHALGSNSDGKIQIKTQKVNNSITLSIKDNGVGIKKENLDKIFTPFFTTKKVGLGTGLGLSISYSIIRELEGNISVVSEQGKGAEFVVTLPIKSSPEAAM